VGDDWGTHNKGKPAPKKIKRRSTNPPPKKVCPFDMVIVLPLLPYALVRLAWDTYRKKY
jgi:hypothetical protein